MLVFIREYRITGRGFTRPVNRTSERSERCPLIYLFTKSFRLSAL